ncbi:MAG: leucine-rich repeat protein, partial [Clostridiales bacterium]|nr:leucine-rich repeat protein [Clostridiales bacterium]
SIGAGAFEGCTALVSVVVQSGAEAIGADAFKGCSKLQAATIPMDSLTSVAPGAFAGTNSALRINGMPYRFSLAGGEIAIEAYLGSEANLSVPGTLFAHPVREIGAKAFENSATLTGITLAAGVLRIGASAFSNCDKLESAVLPAGLTAIGASAFYDCDKLKAVVIPGSVSAISESAFFSCALLETVIIEPGVASIGATAFKNCDKLKALRVPDSVNPINPDAFDGCDFRLLVVTLDGNTGFPYTYFSLKGANIEFDEVIDESMFSIGEILTDNTAVITGYTGDVLHLIIPAEIGGYRIRAIDGGVFAGETHMLKLTVPGTVREIGPGAFEGCPSLEAVTILSGATTVGDEAFKDCGALEKVALPLDTLTYIGKTAFSGCPEIKSFAGGADYVFGRDEGDGGIVLTDYIGSAADVKIPAEISGLKVIGVGEGAFVGTGITDVQLGANVEFVEEGAFKDETKLKKLVLNAKLEEIGANAFKGCEKIAEVVLPEALESIGASAFAGTAIASIEIPKNVESIGDDAFDAAKLKGILVHNDNQHYIAIANALYTKTSRELIRYFGEAAVFELPSGTKVVRAGAFKGNEAVRQVTLCDTLTTIGAEAFANTRLDKIFIPDSVTSIAADAFLNADTANLTATVESTTGEPYLFCLANDILTTVQLVVKPTGVSIDDLVLGVDEAFTLAPTLAPTGAVTSLTYRISNTAVATVDALGVVRAKKVGAAMLYVETDNGKEDACVVVVLAKPAKVYLSASKLTLGVGQTHMLDWALSAGAAGTVVLTSGNALAATVAPDGRITAVAPGTATITARTYNGKTATCTVIVLAEPEKLTLPAAAGTLGIGQQFVLLGALDNGQGNEGLTFKSDNPAVASVGLTDGAISAKRIGFATITVTAYNAALADPDLIKTFAVAVVPAPTTVRFAVSSLSLAVGQTYLLPGIVPIGTAAGMAYKSSKTSVATVSATGLITAKKSGTAYITVKTHNEKTATCKVKVKKAPSSIKLNASSVKLGLGNTFQLSYKLTSGTAATVSFTTNNAAVTTISSAGLITCAASSGTAVITARTHNGKTAKCTVYAVAAPASVRLDDWFLDLGVGQTYRLAGGVFDGVGNDVKSIATHYKFSSSDSSVVSVSSGGKLLARKAGSAIIELRTYNGLSTSCLVSVSKAPSRVTLMYMGKSVNNTTGYMRVGETLQLTAQLPADAGGGYTFASSNSRIVSIDKFTGQVTAHRRGTATVGVKTYNGKIAKCKIRVL